MVTHSKYIELDFVNTLIKPWTELFKFLLQPYSLDPQFSDPIVSARSLAISTSHTWDIYKNKTGIKVSDRELRESSQEAMRVKDLCNTIKHVKRHKGDSANIDTIYAQFIVDKNNRFCFLKNQIIYKHEQDGEFDLMEDIRKAIFYWADKMQINISGCEGWQSKKLKLNPASPAEVITLFYNSKVCIYQGSQCIKLCKVNTDGQLEATVHPNIKFQMIDINGRTPFKRDISGNYIS